MVFLAHFNLIKWKKTSFLALLGKNFPEKLSGLSVKGKNLLFSHWFSVKGVGGGYPLYGQNLLKRFWQFPLYWPNITEDLLVPTSTDPVPPPTKVFLLGKIQNFWWKLCVTFFMSLVCNQDFRTALLTFCWGSNVTEVPLSFDGFNSRKW